MKPTIYDVAKMAGVSIATVSKVLNNKGNISSETINHVLEVVKMLNYRPSVVASALTGKNTNTIGLLVPDIANPFFSEVARSVEDRGHELGFNVVICSTDNNTLKEAQYVDWLQRKSVDGIILSTGAQSKDSLKDILNYGLPTALIARDIPEININSVLVNDFKGGYMATTHLLDLGHKDIGFAADALDNISTKERLRGYKAALENKGIEYKKDRLLLNNSSIEITRENIKKNLNCIEPLSAIFAENDVVAIGIIQAAKESGLSIPQQLSIIGFDDTILARISDPLLTTIAQPIQEMGRRTIDLLVDEINGNQLVKQRIVIDPQLIARRSAIPYGDVSV